MDIGGFVGIGSDGRFGACGTVRNARRCLVGGVGAFLGDGAVVARCGLVRSRCGTEVVGVVGVGGFRGRWISRSEFCAIRIDGLS